MGGRNGTLSSEHRRVQAFPLRAQADIANAQTMIRNEHRASFDIDAAAYAELTQLLNQQLADTVDLFSQIKQAHWHANGMHFYQFHRLFDRLAEDLERHTDTIAKRITTLGGAAKGTLRMCAGGSRLPELPLDVGDGRRTVTLLVERYAQLARSTCKAIAEADKLGDTDTSDLFASASQDLDNAIWFLEVHLRDFRNEYWPALYFVDAQGRIRHHHFGEGDLVAGANAARLAALNALAVARNHLGSLDRVTRIVRLGVMIATSGDVKDQPKIADSVSELLQDIFGQASLPFGKRRG